MALLDDPHRDALAAHRHVLTTWGVPADDLERRLGQAGLTEAGIELEVEVIDEDGLAVRVAVAAEDRGRLNWGVQLVHTGIGDAVLGDDGASLEGQIVELLGRQGLTAGTAESLTSGAIAERLSRPPGASRVFLGGIVSYASAVKHGLLEVPEGPVVTEDAAMAMAGGCGAGARGRRRGRRHRRRRAGRDGGSSGGHRVRRVLARRGGPVRGPDADRVARRDLPGLCVPRPRSSSSPAAGP